jgi:trimeric autotransporter adhesin
MSCTLVALPNGAQSLPVCSLSPVAVKIAAGGTGSTVLTLQTTGSSIATNVVPSPMNLFGLGGGTILAGVLLIGVPARGQCWMVILVLLCVFVVTGASGCRGGGNSNFGSGLGGTGVPATTAGTYTFTVTGVDSANSSTSSINLTLTV